MTTRRLAAILAADVVGYSRMMGVDEAGTLARLQALRREVIDPLVTEHGGRVFKTTGDGFLVAFASAVQALSCAIAIQDALCAQTDGLRLRIGVHQGEVVPEGDDLLGDGVIVAARLEPLAEPGGICISGRVHEDALGKVALSAEDLGETALKNIDRPIRVYRVRPPAAEPAVLLALPDKPSLAVLPFQNMGGDSEQEYFADGMVEEMITALSRMKWLFVIARNSSFAYKGKSPDVRQVGRELGVRYVLEGSVRKAGNRVRLTGQLIDTANGAHIWADRFDGTLDDVFELQDTMTSSVVGAIEPNLRLAEIERAQRKPNSLVGYDLVLRALPLLYGGARNEVEKAARLLRKAVEIDPTYAPSLAHLAALYWVMAVQGWISRGDPAFAEMIDLAQRALARHGEDSDVLRIAGFITALPGGDMKGGMALIEEAIGLNPNSAGGFIMAGHLYAIAGDTKSAIASLERSARLNPRGQAANFHFVRALAHFVAGEHELVIEWTGKALREQPNRADALRYRAASLGRLGRVEEAGQVVQRLLELAPDFNIARVRRHVELNMNNPFKTQAVAESLYEGLRLAGMPE